ncbi:hypothetical protein [Oerskovia flava]|uniref:hypothetical protein n=1 Tax=Oerskovia flava TaxID=2986422 RepID=UPI00223EFE9F|nr:hypothetical protein [Oerskovia sp. JB1-3-2]
MSLPQSTTDQASGPRWARVVTEVLAPGYTVAATIVVVCLLTLDLPAQWWIAVLAFVGMAGLPYAFVHGLARAKVWESRHVRPRGQRMVVLAGLIVIEGLSLWVLGLAGAPAAAMRVLGACVLGVVAMALVTPVVRASIHVGVFSVGAGVMSAFSWPWAVAILAVGALVGLARLAVRDHTRTEVIAGLLVGFTAGALAVRVLG